MKKATKLLTAVAMAAALILGAGAFVSCSNSSDGSSSDAPAIRIDAEALDKTLASFQVVDCNDISDEDEKELVKAYSDAILVAQGKKAGYETAKTAYDALDKNEDATKEIKNTAKTKMDEALKAYKDSVDAFTEINF